MKNLFAIVLCAAFALVAVNAFGQKPKKVSQQARASVSQQNAGHVNITNNTTANSKPACWEITGNNGDIEYRWDTEAKVKQWINEMQTQHNETYTYTTCNHQTEAACDANNEKVNPKKCWKITGTKNGQSLEQYLWSTETVARRKVDAMRDTGYQQAKYVATPASDEKSCNATPSSNDPACWKITINGAVSYQWGYEQDAQTTVNAARNSGQTASYELSPNKTKDNCR